MLTLTRGRPSNARTPHRGTTLAELLVVLAILGVLAGLLVPAVQRARDAANRTHCGNNLRQIGLALHHFHDTQKTFPPGVRYRDGADPYPFMSWNTQLLPFLERDDLWREALRAYSQDKNFLHDPPHAGLATPLRAYACPSDSRTLDVGTANQLRVAFTSYLGVSGSNQFRKDGILYLDSRTRIADITDGTGNTFMVGERPPSADGVFGWWYAGEGQAEDGSGDMVLSVRERNVTPVVPDCPRGPYSFGPGAIRNQCDLFHFWSPHTGGAHFLFADGSARFLRYSADSIFPALATRAGREAVTVPE